MADTFANLVFAPNVNRTGWNIASMSWLNKMGIIVNEEDSSRIPTISEAKYEVQVTYDGALVEGIVIPSMIEFLMTPTEITDVMLKLQRL